MEQHDEIETNGPADSAAPADSGGSSVSETVSSSVPPASAVSVVPAVSSAPVAVAAAVPASIARPVVAPAGKGKVPNNVRRHRIERMMSKAELARRANLSVLTIDRVEKGFGCRMDSKRKILEALGLSLADRVRVFGEEE